MKRLFYLLISFAATSCAVAYQQVATISSPQKFIGQDGQCHFNEGDVTVDYDFWAENGKVSFFVTNNTERDIYIDLSRSFLVVNGMTFDYFQNRTFSSTSYNTYTTSSSYSGVNTFGQASGYASSLAQGYGKTVSGSGYAFGSGSTLTSAFSKTSTVTNTQKNGVEITEKQGVWIPAHASRHFCEFSLLDAPYRLCGLARNPSSRESASVDFQFHGSPFTFENRLMVIIDGQEKPIVNEFFISNISNYLHESIIKTEDMHDCSGKTTGEKRNYNINGADNKFYINYMFNSGEQTDRVSSKNGIVNYTTKKK